MERYLKLVLDDECKIYLTLYKGEKKEVDEYTTKFIDSDEIRYEYSNIIDDFLEENKVLVDSISNSFGHKFRGNIVLLEYPNGITPRKQKVLYKTDLEIYPEITLKLDGIKSKLDHSDDECYEKVRSAIRAYKEYCKKFDDKTRKSLGFTSYKTLTLNAIKRLATPTFESPSLKEYLTDSGDREPSFIPGSKEEREYYEYMNNLPSNIHPHDPGIEDDGYNTIKKVKK